MANLFDRLAQGRPPQETTPQPVPLAAGRLLSWLQNNWKEPVIRAKTLYQFGPHPTRDKESTLKLTAILERHGWLVPMRGPRYDSKWWRVTIGGPDDGSQR
jgi:hypothetical protein